jgi:hypothetical protein
LAAKKGTSKTTKKSSSNKNGKKTTSNKSKSNSKKKDKLNSVCDYVLPKEVLTKAIKIVDGRPTKYHKCMLKKVVEYMFTGLSKSQVANRLGVLHATMNNWCREYNEDGSPNTNFKPDFLSAIKIGEQLSKDWWMEIGKLNLGNKDFNVGLYLINMRNRFGWLGKDHIGIDINNKIEHTEKKVLEVNLNFTDEEKKNFIAGLIDDGTIELPANTEHEH